MRDTMASGYAYRRQVIQPIGGRKLLGVPRWVKRAFPGLIVIALGRLAKAGRLPRNVFAGIRIPSTMRSDEAWLAGHRAAAWDLTIAGLGPIVLAVVAGTGKPAGDRQKVMSQIGTAWLLGWLGVAVVRADRAARAVRAG